MDPHGIHGPPEFWRLRQQPTWIPKWSILQVTSGFLGSFVTETKALDCYATLPSLPRFYLEEVSFMFFLADGGEAHADNFSGTSIGRPSEQILLLLVESCSTDCQLLGLLMSL